MITFLIEHLLTINSAVWRYLKFGREPVIKFFKISSEKKKVKHVWMNLDSVETTAEGDIVTQHHRLPPSRGHLPVSSAQ